MHDQFQGGDNPAVLAGSLTHEPTRSRTVAHCEDTLHAVRSSLAGLSGALRLLTEQRAELPDESLRRVETLVMAEIERLQRLVAPPTADGTTRRSVDGLDLDAVVGHVVLSRRMAGQEVAWTPSGCRVRAATDDLVEVLNILLVNAARHAAGSPARIEVGLRDDVVHLTVSDDGPGVPTELRDSIFERGVRRAHSPGQGLGLAMARELMTQLGGTILLADRSGEGARFELTLPLVPMEGPA